MKTLDEFHFCPVKCAQELAALQRLLGRKTTLSERVDVLPFFKKNKQISALVGALNPRIAKVDRLGHEYDLFGDFACDLIVGDSEKRAYVLLEFEDATERSIFVKRQKYAHEWGSRFEHGFSQVIDWFWKIQDTRVSEDFANRFGHRDCHFMGMLVVGRDSFLEERERSRMKWRMDKVVVDSNSVSCLTFDGLCNDLAHKLSAMQQVGKATRQSGERTTNQRKKAGRRR